MQASDLLAVTRPDDMRVEVLRVGSGCHEVLVAGPFLLDPDRVRDAALRSRYGASGSAYPGLTSRPRWSHRDLTGCLAGLLGRSLEPSQIEWRLSMVTRPLEALTPHQRVPHVDASPMAGVVYLNPPWQCRGGTAFYRHRASGLEALPEALDAPLAVLMLQHGLTSAGALVDWVLSPVPSTGFITGSTEQWELLELVEMHYNRLVLYPGRMFHSGYIEAGDFGEGDGARRLTLNVFVSSAAHPPSQPDEGGSSDGS